MIFSQKIQDLALEAEAALTAQYKHIDEVAFRNTQKVMEAFRAHRVSDACFQSTSGYGYDDRGREVLEEVWADVMGAEAAVVRHTIISGTHAHSWIMSFDDEYTAFMEYAKVYPDNATNKNITYEI